MNDPTMDPTNRPSAVRNIVPPAVSVGVAVLEPPQQLS
jgi:hypothetical protein